MSSGTHRLKLPVFPNEPESGVRVTELPRRPKTRGDCVDGVRPCPWVSCRYHLQIAKVLRTGRVVVAFEEHDDRETCSLDVADEGAHTQEEIGQLVGVTHERVRQIENRALRKLSARADVAEIRDGWTSPHVIDFSEEVVDAEFKAQVARAYERLFGGRK